MMINILIIHHCVEEDLIFNIKLVLSFNFDGYYSVCIWVTVFNYNKLSIKRRFTDIFSLLSYFKSFIYNSKRYELGKLYFHDFISIAIKTKKVFWRNWADGSCIYVNNFISNSLYRAKAAEHNEKQLWFNTKKLEKYDIFSTSVKSLFQSFVMSVSVLHLELFKKEQHLCKTLSNEKLFSRINDLQ